MQSNKKITAQDVADYVGVSRSAVSRAFTDGGSIQPAKRATILAAAKELGYQPNFFARTLSTPAVRKRSHLVAILISDFSNPYQSYLFEALSTVLQQNGKQPMLLSIKQEEDLDTAIMRLSGYQVDGVIAVVGSLPAESFGQCLKLALPLVTLGRSDARGLIPSVQTDNLRAGELAAQHLLSQGLTRLGFVAGRADGQASQERWQGFCRTVQAQGRMAPSRLEAGRYSYQAGFDLATREMAQLQQLEGVFCASDTLAMGLMDCCREISGPAIPRQLKVVGCDNIPPAAWQGYQLTTVAQPVTAIAERVLSQLQRAWDGEQTLAAISCVAPQLMRRSSGG